MNQGTRWFKICIVYFFMYLRPDSPSKTNLIIDSFLLPSGTMYVYWIWMYGWVSWCKIDHRSKHRVRRGEGGFWDWAKLTDVILEHSFTSSVEVSVIVISLLVTQVALNRQTLSTEEESKILVETVQTKCLQLFAVGRTKMCFWVSQIFGTLNIIDTINEWTCQ